MQPEEFTCKRISLPELWSKADEVRDNFWGENFLPIDTEKIVELKLGLEIIPVQGLLSIVDTDAFLKQDLSGIVVDYDCYMKEKFANRMRFSFAHEIGHYFLHREVYSQLSFSTPAEWVHFIQFMPEREYRSFEYQANEFAGRLLVPFLTLNAEVERIKINIKENGLIDYLREDPHSVLERVCPSLCKPFGVSVDVVRTRVYRENLWPPKF